MPSLAAANLLAERESPRTIADDRCPITWHTNADRVAAMEFRVDCTCGAHFMVREGLAGTKRTCTCGRVVTVPPLHELRRQIGLRPYEVSPELVIEHMLASGELPADHACVRCGAETDAVVHVQAECERVQVRTGGEPTWLLVLLLLISPVLLLMGLLLRQRGDQKEYGKDKIYMLPLAVCPKCRSTLRNPTEIKDALCRVPEYRQLLDKFPDASVIVRDVPV
jgi:hypothetical protein